MYQKDNMDLYLQHFIEVHSIDPNKLTHPLHLYIEPAFPVTPGTEGQARMFKLDELDFTVPNAWRELGVHTVEELCHWCVAYLPTYTPPGGFESLQRIIHAIKHQ